MRETNWNSMYKREVKISNILLICWMFENLHNKILGKSNQLRENVTTQIIDRGNIKNT